MWGTHFLLWIVGPQDLSCCILLTLFRSQVCELINAINCHLIDYNLVLVSPIDPRHFCPFCIDFKPQSTGFLFQLRRFFLNLLIGRGNLSYIICKIQVIKFECKPPSNATLVSWKYYLFLVLSTKPNWRWHFYVFYEYNTFLRARKTARRTLVAIMRPVTVFIDLKPVLFLRQRETWHSGENSENGQSVLRWLQVRGGG